MNSALLISSILLCSACSSPREIKNQISIKDITVLKEPSDHMMRDYLTQLVDREFSVRDSILSTLKSAKDWNSRSQDIREFMSLRTGPFPKHTPLNARITGRLDRKEYVIEHIVYESRPNVLVSANLYLPKNTTFPRPAILNITGHNQDGKVSDRTQKICIAQVKKGFVALAIDGLGQGERQIYDIPVGIAHQIIGLQAFLSGTHVFNFMVWDAIRAIDYLVSRPEVNAQKIGITGSSGGGMMSTYILPFEDRITVAVPVANPNTWNYRVHANLATDHEQIFFGAFANSIDPRGDPLFTQVPKPLLINATTDDPLNPARGVWDLSSWLYKSYSAHGAPEKFTTTMVKAAHEYNQEQREITYAWMLRWTDGDSEKFMEENTVVEKIEDLWASKTGSVYNEPNSRHPREWVLKYLSEYQPKLETVDTREKLQNHKESITKSIKNVLNTDFDNIQVTGNFQETRSIGDITISTFVLEPEEEIILPGVLLAHKTKDPNPEVILYLGENGKSDILKEMNLVEQILKKGYLICAIDLRGMGETSPDMKGKLWDFLLGKPIFGQRIGDILATTKWLKESGVGAQNIKLWGTGTAALYGAFAGALSNDISDFLLDKPLLSFESVVQVEVPKYGVEVMLPGILEKFDMPQIYQALSPRSVTLLNPQLGDKTLAANSDLEKTDKIVSKTYKGIKKLKEWHIEQVSDQNRSEIIYNSLTDH